MIQMKGCSIIVCLVALALAGCKKQEPGTPAVITGIDGRYCMCCGGYMITFNGERQPYVAEFFLIDNSADMPFDSSTTRYPIDVLVDFESETKCTGQFIKITKIKVR